MFKFGYNTLPNDDSQYFKNIDTKGVTIPVADPAAYEHYPQYRWMYNKLALCDAQDVEAWPDGYLQITFPIFRKPITNIYGMSAGAEILHTYEEYDKDYKPGYMLMPVLRGTQYSIDVAIDHGKVQWYKCMQGSKDEEGIFILWEFASLPASHQHTMFNWIDNHFGSHTGVVNFEIIDSIIIECHPRMSTQFVDLYGEGWLQSVVDLYKGSGWNFEDNATMGLSMPVWTTEPKKYTFTPECLKTAETTCSSVQIYAEPDKRIDDPGEAHGAKYRLAVINGFTQTGLDLARDEILSGMTVED